MDKKQVITYVKSHPIPVVVSVGSMILASHFIGLGLILTGIAGAGGFIFGKKIEKKSS
jgi:hypothetical protein